MSLFNPLRKPYRRQRGSILVSAIGALLVGVVLLASADIGFAFYAKRELQKAVDMAALTAVQGLRHGGTECTNDSADAAMLGLVSDSVEANLGQVFQVPPVSMTTELNNDAAQTVFVRVTCGVWDPSGVTSPPAPAALAATDAPWYFSADLSGQPANAVRVRAQIQAPGLLPFAGDKWIWAQAVANQDEPLAALSIGSGLASLDEGVLNQVLSGLLGTHVALDLVSYRGLATASVTLLEFLDLLDIDASAGAVDQVLDAEVLLLDWVDAIVTALDEREGVSIAALNTSVINSALQNTAIRLSDVLDLGTNAAHGALTAAVSLADLMMLGLQAANQESLINLGTGIDLGVLAKADVRAHIVEPPRLAVGRAGRDQNGDWYTTAHTAQIRLFLDVRLLNEMSSGELFELSIPLLANVSLAPRSGSFVRLPINLEMAPGDGYLQSLECRYTDGSVAPGVVAADYPVAVIGARAGIANIFLGEMDVDHVVANATTPWNELPKLEFSLLDLRLKVTLLPIWPLSGITLADAFVALKAKADISVPDGADQPYDEVVFTRSEVEQARADGERLKQTVGTNVGVGAAVGGALFNPGLLETRLDISETKLIGVSAGAILDPLVKALGSIVTAVLGVLEPAVNPVLVLVDNIVGPLLEALGVQLGYADVFGPALDEGCLHTARLVY